MWLAEDSNQAEQASGSGAQAATHQDKGAMPQQGALFAVRGSIESSIAKAVITMHAPKWCHRVPPLDRASDWQAVERSGGVRQDHVEQAFHSAKVSLVRAQKNYGPCQLLSSSWLGTLQSICYVIEEQFHAGQGEHARHRTGK